VALVALVAIASSPKAQGNEQRISLTEALRLADENAFVVKAAYHDSLSAEHGLRAAKTAWFPALAVSGNALGFHPQDPLGFGLVQISPDWQEVYVTNVRLNYAIYTGGRRTNEVGRQRENLGTASSDLAATKLANAYDCRQAYIGLLIAERTLASAEASSQRITIIRTDVENLFAAGMADSVDILETELSLRGIQRLLEESRNRRRNASATLARILGVAENETIVPTELIPEPDPLRVDRPEGRGDVAHRPELSAVDHRIESARYQRSLVKSNFFPVVNGMGGYSLVKPNIGERESSWQEMWFLGLTLSWDLNLGGKEFSESSQALEAIRSLEMKRKDLENTLALQAQIAWNNIDETYEVYTISRDEFNIATRRFALAQDKQKAGQMTVNRLLELEAELTQTEQQFEVTRLRYFAAVTDYLYAVGSDAIRGGF
jgi:outer membrane protein TolC